MDMALMVSDCYRYSDSGNLNCNVCFNVFVCCSPAADLPLFLGCTKSLSRVVGKCIAQLSSGIPLSAQTQGSPHWC